jgi:hypothetical protein
VTTLGKPFNLDNLYTAVAATAERMAYQSGGD